MAAETSVTARGRRRGWRLWLTALCLPLSACDGCPFLGDSEAGPTDIATIEVECTATPKSGPAPLAVEFTATSPALPARYRWLFGDGGEADGPDAVHVYGPGTYTPRVDVESVQFIVRRSGSCSPGTITVGAVQAPGPR